MNSTIYRFSCENEPPIQQGDIFCNLPYFNYDYLMKSRSERLKIPKDESDVILNKILQDGGQVLIEGFYYCEWGILASQDCDIHSNKDLIFYPLIPVTSLLKKKNIIEAVEDNIIKSTRHIYIPKLNIADGEAYGPFEINFYNPFNVPYNLLLNNLKYCWKARLIEKARKIFIGKLTQFYSRTPVDEFIFLENKEITNYLITDWKKIWKDKSDDKYKKGLIRIEQIKKILRSVKREKDVDMVFYYDLTLVDKIKNILSQIEWFSNTKDLINLVKLIKNNFINNPLMANESFKDLIKNYYLIENSFIKKFESFLDQYYDDLKEVRKNILQGEECNLELIITIFPLEKTEKKKVIKVTIEKIFSARTAMREIPRYILNHYDFLNHTD